MAGIPIDVKEPVSNFVLEMLNTNGNGVDNRSLEVAETIVVRTMHKIVKSTEVIRRFSDAVVDRPG